MVREMLFISLMMLCLAQGPIATISQSLQDCPQHRPLLVNPQDKSITRHPLSGLENTTLKQQ